MDQTTAEDDSTSRPTADDTPAETLAETLAAPSNAPATQASAEYPTATLSPDPALRLASLLTEALPRSGTDTSKSSATPTATASQHRSGLRFRILRPHAAGGLGTVSVAKDEELNREVALKEIQPSYADNPSARARFILEAEVTGGLEHPSIVPVYGLGCYPDGRPYYAMRFIKGKSLQEVTDRFHRCSITASSDIASSSTASSSIATADLLAQKIELRQLLTRFITVCQAIEYAHSRGVLHRDIKPANIMLGDYGETLMVDWGLAKVQSLPDLASVPRSETPWLPSTESGSEPTQMGTIVGTIQFMSPEQASGDIDRLGPPSDVYSLGATLYYLLTGKTAFSGANRIELLENVRAGHFPPPTRWNRSIAKPLEAICLHAMARTPSERYPSAAALASDLERWLADEPVSVMQESSSERLARWLRRHRTWFRAASAAILSIVAILALAIVLVNGQRKVAVQQRERAEQLAVEKTELAARETDLRKQAQWQAASRSFEQSLFRCQQADPTTGLLSLVNNLLEAQTIEAHELERSIRAQLGGWSNAVHSLEAIVDLKNPIRTLVQSPDGKSMLIATAEKAIFFDPRTRQTIGEPLPVEGAIHTARFSLDGRVLMTGGEDQAVRFWDPATGKESGKPLLHDAPVVAIAASHDMKYLAAASGKVVRIWLLEDRAPTDVSLQHPHELTAIQFSPVEPLLFAADWHGEVHCWNVTNGQPVGTPLKHDSAVLALDISPDGKTLATGELSNQVRRWDVALRSFVGIPMQHQGMVRKVAFSADGTRLLSASADQTVRLWDASNDQPIGPAMRHPHMADAAIFDQDSKFVWTGCDDGGLRRWQVANTNSRSLPVGKNGNIVAAEFDHTILRTLSSALVAPGYSLPGELHQWDAQANIATTKPLTSVAWFEPALFAPGGKLFAAATASPGVQVFATDTGREVSPPIPLTDNPKALAFNDAGTLLLVGTEKGLLQCFQVQGGIQVGETIELGNRIASLNFFPGLRKVLLGSWDQTAKLLSLPLSNRDTPATLEHNQLVVATDIHPSGSTFLTATSDGNIRLWNSSTLSQQGTVMKHSSRVKLARFSADGQTILATYHDGSIRHWDSRTGEEIGTAVRQSKEIMALALDPTGQWAATASSDWTARLWSLGPMAGTYEQVKARCEAQSAVEMKADKSIQVLTIPDWRARQTIFSPRPL